MCSDISAQHQSTTVAAAGAIGVADFDVSMLVSGGEDEGSSIASFRLAMTVLKVLYNNRASALPAAEALVYWIRAYDAMPSHERAKLLKPLLSRPIEEVVQSNSREDDRSRENVHSVYCGQIALVLHRVSTGAIKFRLNAYNGPICRDDIVHALTESS